MNIVPGRVRKRVQSLRRRLWYRYAPGVFRQRAQLRLRRPRSGRKHRLPGELIVSVTSFPPRFGTLHLTLGCLLDQGVKADRTILWIAHSDLDRLPASVRQLERRGLEIRGCEDLRSYKKLIPALEAFPDAYIATADDDVYYPADWLEELVDGLSPAGGVITFHRGHRIGRRPDGGFAPYRERDNNVHDDAARRPSDDLLPTGIGGILYPPHSLDPRVTDRALFQRLCPDGDDLWFHWCARMAGTKYRKVGPKMKQVIWDGTQDSALYNSNETGGNDRMIAALVKEFGYPG